MLALQELTISSYHNLRLDPIGLIRHIISRILTVFRQTLHMEIYSIIGVITGLWANEEHNIKPAGPEHLNCILWKRFSKMETLFKISK